MKLKLADIFGENTILQRDKEIRIWGSSANHDTVTVELNGLKEEVPAEKGRWSVTFPAQKACAKTTMSVRSLHTKEKIVFENIAIGEVFLAGGQSNMEFLMKYDFDYEETVKSEDDPLLRCYTSPQTAFKGFLEINDKPEAGFWRTWEDKEDRGMFSAIGTYMGMILRKKLNVPVGIISCNWGGTPAAAWTAPEDLREEKVLEKILKWHEDACDNTNWQKYITASEVRAPDMTPEQLEFERRFMMGEFGKEFFENFDPSSLPVLDYAPYGPGPRSNVRPSGLYENMLKEVAPYGIRAFLWYQGEDDDARDWADIYDVSMITLIRSWRKLWNEDLAFYQIELAPFEGVGVTGAKKYDLMRHQQAKAAEALNDVYDVCILDAGERYNIHPRHKKMVGERLARIVLKHSFGDTSLTADCPKMIKAERDKDIFLCFSNAADGMIIKGDLKKYLILECGGRRPDYEAEIRADTLILKGDFPKEKITVRFCESNYVEDPLFNSEGDPAFPFTCEV